MRSVWKSFASVRLAIFLIILLALASVVGTLIPQGRGAEEYAARYGDLAGLFAKLQLTRLYRSSWFLTLLFLFAVNLTVCTVSRLGPRLRRAFGPPSATDAASVAAMRIKGRVRLSGPPAQAAAGISRELAARRYAVRAADGENGTVLLARKRRLGWFGSEAVHLGLLVILAGGIVSGLAGRRSHLPLLEGQTADVPHADFRIRLDRFETEYYPQGGVKAWKSTVSVLENGAPVRTEVVVVNRPLVHRGFHFYQSSYGWDWQSPSVEIVVGRKDDASAARSVTLRTGDRAAVDGPGITHLGVRRFVPDFVLGEGNRVQSRSGEPRNPAALVEAWQGDEQVFSGWIFAKFPDFGEGHGDGRAALTFVLKDFQASPYSVLEAAKDPGAGLIWLGCLFISAGLFLAFYWTPREIRAVVEPGPGGGTEAVLGGFAAKGRDAFRSEFEAVCKSLRRV
jgi:cytochrome c biogenesis protein